MSKYVIEDTTLTGIADAIRGKTGGTAAIPVSNMAAQIRGIQSKIKASVTFTNASGYDLHLIAPGGVTKSVSNGASVSFTTTGSFVVYFWPDDINYAVMLSGTGGPWIDFTWNGCSVETTWYAACFSPVASTVTVRAIAG